MTAARKILRKSAKEWKPKEAKIATTAKIKSKDPKNIKSSKYVFCTSKEGLKYAPSKVMIKIPMIVSTSERYSLIFTPFLLKLFRKA